MFAILAFILNFILSYYVYVSQQYTKVLGNKPDTDFK